MDEKYDNQLTSQSLLLDDICRRLPIFTFSHYRLAFLNFMEVLILIKCTIGMIVSNFGVYRLK